MAHLMAPQPSSPGLPVFFNVDGVVGAAPAQNLREDVLLVQFLLSVGSRVNADPVAKAIHGAVKVTGVIDPAGFGLVVGVGLLVAMD